jgi:hypothetical protein
MRRVPLGAKTTSLKDILEEDLAEEIGDKISEIGNPPGTVGVADKTVLDNGFQTSEIGNTKTDIANPVSEIGDQKSDIILKKSDKLIPISEKGFPASNIIDPNSELGNKISGTDERPSENVPAPISEIRNQKAEKGDKSEYQKVTATLEPKLLWLLEDERRRRRMAKLEYSFSEIIREALTDYFVKQGREV